MRRLPHAILLAAAVAALWAAAPAAAQDPTVPPTVIAPADGATIAAGSSVTFQVSSDVPNDQYLWVHVSRSPVPADSCGTIGDDVATVSIDPTADPSLYAGTPYASDLYDYWLNRAGTYYWQAYRIHYPDGCIEAPVRTLTITGIRPVELGPQPLEPADNAVMPTGGVAFRISVAFTDPSQYLWLHVSRSPQRDGTGLIGDDAEIEKFLPSGDPAVWSAIPTYFASSTFWMNVAGTYYWQPHRISGFGDPDGYVEGPVRSFTLTASPRPTPTPTPTPTPAPAATIRGDDAFIEGTANDLYLACTKLNVYLVDVLPAATKVSVTGAADLRLVGRTVRILLDGKQVGTATVRMDGSFAAIVRAPSRARRAKARYRAVVGDSQSQNLKLVRRMVAAKLTRSGDRLTLTGRIARPFARRPAKVGIQRYVACGRLQTLSVRTVRPTGSGRFSVRFAVPDEAVRALMYRATTRVASRPGGIAAHRTFTLPRAINLVSG